MSYRRRPGPIAALFWLFIAICALVALAEAYPPVTAPFAVLLVVLILSGALRRRRPTPTGRASAPGQVAPTEPVEKVWLRARCEHCGAPRTHGADECRFCGRSLVVARATVS